MALIKADIVEKIHDKLTLPRHECARIVERLFEIMADELSRGNKVMIPGFGKWAVKAKKAQKGRNPITGEDLTIDARRVVTFTPSIVLRGAMNSGDRWNRDGYKIRYARSRYLQGTAHGRGYSVGTPAQSTR